MRNTFDPLDMKFSLCAAAVAAATILGEGAASPVLARRDKDLVFGQRKSAGQNGPTKEEKEAMKYFHEPGYVLSRADFATGSSYPETASMLRLAKRRTSRHDFSRTMLIEE